MEQLEHTTTSNKENTSTAYITEVYKDAFISYGRGESLSFVARLHQKIKLDGKDAWFDKVNIPHGDDYLQRIHHGIENAQNFIFVIAPHAVRSIYCLQEVIHARKFGKRIIPVLHIMPDNNDWDYALKQEQEKGNIKLCEELQEAIGQLTKTDWIYAREKLGDMVAYGEWKENYENEWKKHTNTAYLEKWESPIQWDVTDNLDSVYNKITGILNHEYEYIYQHTDLLNKAIAWAKKNKPTQELLVGQQREKAEKWLLTEFTDGRQRPCLASTLHTEFLNESRKNGENLQTDVFICYARQFTEETKDIATNLQQNLITTWVDLDDIEKGSLYSKEILSGIEKADYFLFLISPYSVTSKFCLKELDYALSLNKKIIPIKVTQTDDSTLPDNIRDSQYLEWNNDGKSLLVKQIKEDKDYFYQHKIYLTQSLKWSRQDKNPAILLRGRALEKALAWLDGCHTREHHLPTEIQKEFIQQSDLHRNELEYEVFISYSRKDGDFVRKFNNLLELHGRTTWFDQENIPAGAEDFWEEIKKGIDASDNYLFVISPDSVTSPFCEKEVKYASEQGKRILTIKYRSVDEVLIPKELGKINWVDFEGYKDLTRPIGLLLRTLDTDREHVKAHAQWDKKAREWEKNIWGNEFLLKNDALTSAVEWVNTAESENKSPRPTLLQKAFIEASEEEYNRELAIEKKTAKRNTSIKGLIYSSIVILSSIICFLIIERQDADENTLDHKIMMFHTLAELSHEVGKHQIANQFDKKAFELSPSKASSPYFKKPSFLKIHDGSRHVHYLENGYIDQTPYTLNLYDSDDDLYPDNYPSHGEIITSSDYSPVKDLLIYGHDNGTVTMRQKGDGLSSKITIFSNSSPIEKVVISPDGNYLLIIRKEQSPILWNISDKDNKTKKMALLRQKGDIKTISFSPNSKHLLMLYTNEYLDLWYLPELQWQTEFPVSNHTKYANEYIYSDTIQNVYTVSTENTSMFNRISHANENEGIEHILGKNQFAVFTAENTLLTSYDKTISQWKVDEKIVTFKKNHTHYYSIKYFDYSHKHKLMLIVDEYNKVELWNTHQKVLAEVQYTEDDEIQDISFTQNGKYFNVKLPIRIDTWNLSIKDWQNYYIPASIDDSVLKDFIKNPKEHYFEPIPDYSTEDVDETTSFPYITK